MINNFFGIYGNINKVLIDRLKKYCLIEYFSKESANLARDIYYNFKLKKRAIKISYSYYEEIKIKNVYNYQDYMVVYRNNHRHRDTTESPKNKTPKKTVSLRIVESPSVTKILDTDDLSEIKARLLKTLITSA